MPNVPNRTPYSVPEEASGGEKQKKSRQKSWSSISDVAGRGGPIGGAEEEDDGLHLDKRANKHETRRQLNHHHPSVAFPCYSHHVFAIDFVFPLFSFDRFSVPRVHLLPPLPRDLAYVSPCSP